MVYRQKIKDIYHLKQVLISCLDMIRQELINGAIDLQFWIIFDKQHQHTFRNDTPIQLSRSLHFYLLLLLTTYSVRRTSASVTTVIIVFSIEAMIFNSLVSDLTLRKN